MAITTALWGITLRFSRLLSAAVLAGSLTLTAGCAAEPPPAASEKVQAYYEENNKFEELKAPEPIKLPAGALTPGNKALFFGDSWTAGYASKPSEEGFAYRTGKTLGLKYDVQGASGTGYVNPADKMPYKDRMATLPSDADVKLIVLQGGLNDEAFDQSGLFASATTAVETAKEKMPNAAIVLVGPAPSVLPVSPNLLNVERILMDVALTQNLPYISPLREEWISEANFKDVIDTTAANHPSTAGHAYLAEKLVAALQGIAS